MAVSIHLKQFDGPLDLLLQLVDKAKIDLQDIFVSQITEQYIRIVQNAPDFDLEEASEFINMAAILVEIKSRKLLPKPVKEEEEDPEQLLIRRLTEYKLYKESAGQMAQFEESAFQVFGKLPEEFPLPPQAFEWEGLTLQALWEALLRVRNRKGKEKTPEPFYRMRDIQREEYTVEASIETIESHLRSGRVVFSELISPYPEKEEIVTLFLAILEVLKLGKAHLSQKEAFGEIILLPGRKKNDAEESASDEYE